MSKNTGKAFELLAKRVFEFLLKQDKVENLEVKHDVILQGRSTSHQIDVYWKFRAGGVVYQTIVQAKDWGNRVKQEQLLAFAAVLDDLPGQPRGVFLTRTGYQSGAKDVAESRGIILYELREPTDDDFDKTIRFLNIELNARVPQLLELTITPDRSWLEDATHKLGIPKGTTFNVSFSTESDFLDEHGDPTFSVASVLDKYLYAGEGEVTARRIEHEFQVPAFVETDLPQLPLVRVRSLDFTYSVGVVSTRIDFDLKDFVGVVLRNVLDDQEAAQMFGRESSVVIDSPPDGDGHSAG